MRRTYPELRTEIARLEAEAGRTRQFELPTVIADLNLLIERYKLTAATIFGTSRNENPGRPKTVRVPKFVDQVTGNTWTGRGQMGIPDHRDRRFRMNVTEHSART